jgi:hypothetical protein
MGGSLPGTCLPCSSFFLNQTKLPERNFPHTKTAANIVRGKDADGKIRHRPFTIWWQVPNTQTLPVKTSKNLNT